ncbi:amphi-Trp domain-containing protein, partial [Natrinema soli]
MADEPDDADRPDESVTDEAAFELERTYDRADLAAVFREFATAFESGRAVRLDGDERSVDIAVPQRVVAEFETEREPDAEPPVAELELEIEWDDPDGSSLRVTDRDAR